MFFTLLLIEFLKSTLNMKVPLCLFGIRLIIDIIYYVQQV